MDLINFWLWNFQKKYSFTNNAFYILFTDLPL